jgi:dihydroorotase-like cyclic amidohydrolase
MDGIVRAARMLNRRWQEIWDLFSGRPARLVDLTTELKVGSAADFCLVETTKENRLCGLHVCAGGELKNSKLQF